MKNFIFILLLFSFSLINAQLISDYKYIIVPEKFEGFEADEYKLNTYLKNLLDKKNYEILSENVQSWPAEVQQNSCLAATAGATKLKNFLKNKIEIYFTNCEQKQFGLYEATSAIKQYDKGYQDAMKIAVKRIPDSNPREISGLHPQPVKQIQTEVAETLKENPAQNSVNNLYTNGDLNLTKSDLTDGSFLLINDKNSQVYAQFYPSAKKGIFHVKVIDSKENYETIGYFDGTNLEIELRSSVNQWTLTQFKNNQ